MHTIRSATASDLHHFLKILQLELSGDVFRDAAACIETEFLELGDNREIYIMFEQSQPIAAVQIILKNADADPELANGRTIAHVHHLRVASNRRREGIGRTLMLSMESQYRTKGFQMLTLGVDNWNETAIRFYNDLGYTLFKEEPGRTPDEIVHYLRKSL